MLVRAGLAAAADGVQSCSSAAGPAAKSIGPGALTFAPACILATNQHFPIMADNDDNDELLGIASTSATASGSGGSQYRYSQEIGQMVREGVAAAYTLLPLTRRLLSSLRCSSSAR